MDWRIWVYERVSTDADVLEVVPVERIFGAGAMDATPDDKPFIQLKFGSKVKDAGPGLYRQFMTVWVHDVPGDYMRIDQVLGLIQKAFNVRIGQEGGIKAQWIGDSQDLSDEGHNTITRNATYALVGAEGES